MEIAQSLNTISDLDSYLDRCNAQMQLGEELLCHGMSALCERRLLRRKQYPSWRYKITAAWIYGWHQMMAKLTPWHYRMLSGDNRRTYSRTEILGRICRAGFEIELEWMDLESYELYIRARKVSEPVDHIGSSTSPIIKLQRRGLGGKMITVYKLRTMHSYSQYLQRYVHDQHGLDKSGKLANDFRVNIWGRMLRPLWLDELPMIWNVIRGDMKIVGVRPLSEHYYKLYTPEMQQLRIRVKPGLIPPFYYEKETPHIHDEYPEGDPRRLEELEESERRYIEAYLQHPLRTDWHYFWGTLSNIVLRRKRSH